MTRGGAAPAGVAGPRARTVGVFCVRMLQTGVSVSDARPARNAGHGGTVRPAAGRLPTVPRAAQPPLRAFQISSQGQRRAHSRVT